ncbi:Calcium-transporting P-type ATPase, PMR1-type protein [Ceratobasidium theobromae]|uniref:Calcium-transporting P-type ATPase, PMR1-type protein n=1 Tax=Ceratobasidium theobromae TaxID=1582974 RepID=A0A5N5QIS2_9AGAM|nr:Calcium-transporting P-type ATPase, PMR1-type protein [Ceratobasidium theobromae]
MDSDKERSSPREPLSMEDLLRMAGYRRGMRASSPPAQSYFDMVESGFHPISPDAGLHFAYSTTLHRHEIPINMHWACKDP